MVHINKHKFFLIQILKDIYSDIELANCLGFCKQELKIQ